MSRHVSQTIARPGKKISVYIAEQMKDKGYYRAVDAIDPTLLGNTVERVQTAIKGKKILSNEQEAKAASVCRYHVCGNPGNMLKYSHRR